MASQRICTICQKEIVLRPSAAERARKYGGKPSDYIDIFTAHGDCLVEKSRLDTIELMNKQKPTTKGK
jgi:hypothetical protein